MLRRISAAPVARSSASAAHPATAAVSARLRASAMTKYVHMSEPIGNGKVIPLKFDYVRPAYMCPTLAQYYVTVTAWVEFFLLPRLGFCFFVIFTIHGGFVGEWPPDTHVINN
jgi:hypothetical protein